MDNRWQYDPNQDPGFLPPDSDLKPFGDWLRGRPYAALGKGLPHDLWTQDPAEKQANDSALWESAMGLGTAGAPVRVVRSPNMIGRPGAKTQYGDEVKFQYYPEGQPENVMGEGALLERPDKSLQWNMMWSDAKMGEGRIVDKIRKTYSPKQLNEMELSGILPEAIPSWTRFASRIERRIPDLLPLARNIKENISAVKQDLNRWKDEGYNYEIPKNTLAAREAGGAKEGFWKEQLPVPSSREQALTYANSKPTVQFSDPEAFRSFWQARSPREREILGEVSQQAYGASPQGWVMGEREAMGPRTQEAALNRASQLANRWKQTEPYMALGETPPLPAPASRAPRFDRWEEPYNYYSNLSPEHQASLDAYTRTGRPLADAPNFKSYINRGTHSGLANVSTDELVRDWFNTLLPGSGGR